MRFADLHMLHWLWALAILGAGIYFALNRRKSILRRLAGPFVNELAADYDDRRRVVKAFLLAAVFFWSILALARPQWGFEWREVKRQGLDIFIAIDTSKSMLTQDVKPTRLDRAKLALQDFVRGLNGDRVGLIAFAGEAFLVCPLTVDYNGFLLALHDLDTTSIPKKGTNVGSAIAHALEGYEKIPSKYKVLIIITDGENLQGEPLEQAKRAKEKGVRVFSVGVGTNEGELIRVRSESGEYEFLKDIQGNFVKSRLNEEVLQEIALMADGAYVRSSGANFGLDLIYERELAGIEKREIESKMEKTYYDRFQIPLAIALLLLIIETIMTTKRSSPSNGGGSSLAWITPRALGISLVVLALWRVDPVLAATIRQDARRGNSLFKQEQYAEALESYKRGLKKNPDSDIMNFNAGTALYKKQDYKAALDHFQKALLGEGEALKRKTYYNLGNTHYRLGEQQEGRDIGAAIQSLEKALSYYEKALGIDPEDEDTKYNYEYARKELERLKQKRQAQQEQRQKQQQSQQQQQKQSDQEPSQTQPQPSGESQEQRNTESAEDQRGESPKESPQESREESPQESSQKSPGKFQDESSQESSDALPEESGDQHSAGQSDPEGEMSPREARMLLNDYQQNEAPRGLFAVPEHRPDTDDVLKDW